MGRKVTPKDYRELIGIARSACPEIAITTDIITGFPGESDDEFRESLTYVQEINFAGGHVFPYNERPGTVAAQMPNQVTHFVRKERGKEMRSVIASSAQRYRKRFLGKLMSVLWEHGEETTAGRWQLSGITDNYLRLYAQSTNDLRNCISTVRITEESPKGMQAEIIAAETDIDDI
jgi:threonylcarbamoyladenosine tRNA methylthiotransferase MtaB